MVAPCYIIICYAFALTGRGLTRYAKLPRVSLRLPWAMGFCPYRAYTNKWCQPLWPLNFERLTGHPNILFYHEFFYISKLIISTDNHAVSHVESTHNLIVLRILSANFNFHLRCFLAIGR